MNAIEREKKMVDECLWLLRASDKEVADKYHQTVERANEFKLTRVEGLLYNVSDFLQMDLEDAAEKQVKKQAEKTSATNTDSLQMLKLK